MNWIIVSTGNSLLNFLLKLEPYFHYEICFLFLKILFYVLFPLYFKTFQIEIDVSMVKYWFHVFKICIQCLCFVFEFLIFYKIRILLDLYMLKYLPPKHKCISWDYRFQFSIIYISIRRKLIEIDTQNICCYELSNHVYL